MYSFDENSCIVDHREYRKIVENKFWTNIRPSFRMNFNRGEEQKGKFLRESI